jgi:CO/xanthine dehydrogenase Mo-binding subunit
LPDLQSQVGAYGAGRIVNSLVATRQCTDGMVGGIGMR